MSMIQFNEADSRIMRRLVLAGVVLLFVAGAQSAFALACGDLITSDTKLTRNLGPCPGDGLRIAANNPLTLDLNGHQILGSGAGNGIRVFGTDIVVKGHGRVANFDVGVNVNGGRRVMVYDLELDRNTIGVSLGFSTAVRVFDNTIHAGRRGTIGVSTTDLADSFIYRNEIKGFSNVGIWLGQGNPVVTENIVAKNNTGIHFGTDGTYTVRGNFVMNNDGNGIEANVLSAGSCGRIEDNTVKENGGNGIVVTGERVFGSCRVQNNLVRENLLNGIAISGGRDHQVLGNRLAGNGTDLFWDGISTSCWEQNVFLSSSPETLPACNPF